MICFDILHIILLSRETVKHPNVADSEKLSFRLTTVDELHNLSSQLELQTDGFNLKSFLQGTQKGDYCLLTYVDNEMAGFTCAHLEGRPRIHSGCRLKLPKSLTYNYAGFTFPRFRGHNHQSLRHYELFHQPKWNGKIGLIGYVHYTNWRSLSGVKKSGYQNIGKVWIFGVKSKYFVWLSRNLKKMGIREA